MKRIKVADNLHLYIPSIIACMGREIVIQKRTNENAIDAFWNFYLSNVRIIKSECLFQIGLEFVDIRIKHGVRVKWKCTKKLNAKLIQCLC